MAPGSSLSLAHPFFWIVWAIAARVVWCAFAYGSGPFGFVFLFSLFSFSFFSTSGLAPAIPEDLYYMIKKAVNVRRHLERNRKDKDSKFRLILVEVRRGFEPVFFELNFRSFVILRFVFFLLQFFSVSITCTVFRHSLVSTASRVTTRPAVNCRRCGSTRPPPRRPSSRKNARISPDSCAFYQPLSNNTEPLKSSCFARRRLRKEEEHNRCILFV
jgi:ribosomal protein S15P/S13E